jgi:hypothetical protein
MSITRQWQRLIAGLTVVLLAIAAVIVPATTTAQTNGVYDLFSSEQTGYFFFWDPGEWSLEQEGSEPGQDRVRFVERASNGEVLLDLWAFEAPGVTPVECMRGAIDMLAADPATLELTELTAEGGPLIVDGGSLEFVLTVAQGDERDTFAFHVECTEIVPGQSLRLKSLSVPASIYNERGVPLFILDPDLRVFETLTQHGSPLAIPDETGAATGALDGTNTCKDARTVFMLARNVNGQTPFIIDLSAFQATDIDGVPLPATVTMTFPETPPGSSLAVPPQETAILQIVVASDYFNLSYASPSGEAIALGPFFEGGCGAGGGAPVLIDIE